MKQNMLVCERCEMTYGMPTHAIPIEQYLTVLNEFKEAHKNCKDGK